MASLAFRPWPRNPPQGGSLKEVLGRVSVERGHFRNITEASLQEEVAAEGALELSESEDDEAVEGQRDAAPSIAKPATREDLYKAKYDMLQHLDAAHNDVMLALDFVSLLLSKDNKQAASTISPALKNEIPVGTLGIDLWQNMPKDRARETQDELLSTKVRMESLQNSANSLLAAANRLEDNVRKETQYWSEVLSIADKGWNVCRLPGQQRRLGVTFGFSESAPDFSRRGVAGLNPGPDGGVALDRGIGVKPKALRVQLRRGGAVVGTSPIPTLAEGGETALEARIRYARDGLFDEELYHEIVRESRSLASLGVNVEGQAVSFKSQPTAEGLVECRFELISLDEADTPPSPDERQTYLAHAISIAARLLLSQAHRDRLQKRQEIPLPLSGNKEERAVLRILRPLMAFMLHDTAIGQVNSLVTCAQSLLTGAKVAHEVERASFQPPTLEDAVTSEALMAALMKPWLSQITLSLRDSEQVVLKLETTLASRFGTLYSLDGPFHKQAYRFDSFLEARQAFDEVLASVLADLLYPALGEGWKCNIREALLTKSTSAEGAEAAIWITVNSETGSLALSSPTKKINWASGDSSNPNQSLLEACKELVG
ncbi:hypothetical protein BAUCODRAFT_257649 [Baudoinia panamericana UAMH 10762]|uniref:Mediator of RNA polymerase II transcription subunit 17 n=1 Tax=Baudoinia panamericana (strain UAMH 10762) TaxID=717646 RepID=M2LF62_BAUPA|nr:uncharacterized protein BAUCODRAFT_257649 [Baudoinia panamericana UAMH 10762]EMC92672.1 hypothetical protein BAUCODRAFT_257649 [Baudoinia panamericana UAMH 10762]